ncbi:MAG: 4Fe-4S dicluster domain-containing protein [Candidatus Lokiarchaeota archaeon]|nr:4Fe-4S dicluster domain-containing protein [Candidatus Lokiarchaeota archaeon]
MSIIIDKEKCTGCGACYESCPNDAIDFDENDIAFVTEECTLCKICIDECPVGAISLEKQIEIAKIDLSDYKGVWIFVEHNNEVIHHVSLELLGIGQKLASKLGNEISAVLIGDNIEDKANLLFHYGADKVYIIEDERLKKYRSIPYTDALEILVNKYKPEILLFGATKLGRDLAPRLATRLNTGLTADCTGLEIEDRNLIQTRPAYGGNIMATIKTSRHRPQMATVRPKVFKMPEKDPSRTGNIIKEEIDITKSDIWSEVVDIIREAKGTANLEEAEIIVSGGRGLGDPKNFKLLEEFASCLGGNVCIGASRAVVDAGWIPHYHQVGQTGKTVQPKIYIACGISGAIQHLIGMKTSDVIIAINKDPEAPIFKVADIGIIGDLFDIIPEIIKRLKI